jgi:hypothetical protein
MHAPVMAWDSREERENERPRVLTYTRKGVNLRTKVLPRVTRDILWTEVNGHAILNVYQSREALEPALTYIQELTPPSRCVIGGDMNARHESFEPGSVTTGGGSELARWAQTHAMDFIGQPGVPTHRAGHVIDLTFSNIPFAAVRAEKLPGCTLLTSSRAFESAVLIFAILASFLVYRTLHKYTLSGTNRGVSEESRWTVLTERATAWSTMRFSASEADVLGEQELQN